MSQQYLRLSVAGMLLFFATAEGATHRVPSDFPTIQAGVDAAADGDTVLVAPGVYSDYETRPIASGIWTSCLFLKSGIVVRSQGGSAVTTIHMPVVAAQPSIIYGEYMSSMVTAVEGFTVTSVPLYFSGVFVIFSGKITFRDCVFRDLVGFSTNAGINVNNGDLDVIDCEFLNCRTEAGGAGAGIYFSHGQLRVFDSQFENCDSRAIYFSGSGLGDVLWIENSEFVNCRGRTGGAIVTGVVLGGTTIRGCVFKDNLDTRSGGGAISFNAFGTRLVENCAFLFNRSEGANGQGGAINVVGAACTVRGCTFYGNSQTYGAPGAAVNFSLNASGSMLERCIVAESVGPPAVGGFPGTIVTTSCNVFWNNPGGHVDGIFITLTPTDRVIDPLFCDPVGLDFTLMKSSPCLPEDALGCGQIGAYGEGCGFVSVQGTSWGKVKCDFREGEK